MSNPYGFLTQTGRSKEAAALANGTALTVAEIVLGDASDAPTGGETALRSEIGRHAVSAKGATDNDNEVFFRLELGVDDGPYPSIREAGVVDADGDLIAIVHYPVPVSKPTGFSLTLDVVVVFSDIDNLILRTEASSTLVPEERKIKAGVGLKGGGDLSADRALSVDFASSAEVLAGIVDDKAITPASLAAVRGIAATGPIANRVYRDRQSGLIVQFMRIQTVGGADGEVLSFPVSFPNECAAVVGNDRVYGAHVVAAVPISPAQFRLYGRNPVSGAYDPTATQLVAFGF